MKSKKSNLFKGLFLSTVIMITSSTSVFANTHTVDASFTKSQLVKEVVQTRNSSEVLYTIKTPTNDVFIARENRFGNGDDFSEYTLYHRIDNKKNRIDFKLIAEKGTKLGKLENSLGIYTSKELENGRIEYNFHYSLFGYKNHRVININTYNNK